MPPTTDARPILVELPAELVAQIAEAVAERLADATAPSPYLNTNEAAEYLRAPVSRMHDLRQRGELVPSLDGRRLLFKRVDLDAYLDRNRRAG